MRHRQRYKALFVAAYWCVLFSGLLGAALLAFGEKEPRESDRENRYLAGFPALSAETVLDGSFMTGFEAYLSDGFFYRDALVRAADSLMARFSVVTLDERLAVDANMEKEFAALMGDADDPAIATPAARTNAPDDTAAPGDAPGQDALTGETEPGGEPTVSAPNEPGDAQGDDAGTYELPQLGDVADAYTFWKVTPDGTQDRVYQFPRENVAAVARTLNAYRDALPADGTLHFAQVPYPQIARALRDGYAVGWGSDMEQALQSLVKEGVTIHSTTDVLQQPLLDKQYVYFRTDHHWAPRGAYLLTAAIMEAQGVPAVSYDDFSYTIHNGFVGSLGKGTPGSDLSGRADSLELLHPAAPAASLVLSSIGDAGEELPLIGYSRRSYTAFLMGTRTPWRRIVTGFHTGREALILTDSYGNAFAPYLLPYFDEVHMADLRRNYFSLEDAGGTVRQYIEHHGVTDIYVILSTASSINASYMLTYMPAYLG